MPAEPTSSIAPVWQIWRNPIVWRYSRSQLRGKQTIFSVLLLVMVMYFTAAMVYLPATQHGTDPVVAARMLFIPALIIQWLVLLTLGTGAVASGIVNERLTGALDYQRLAPLTPMHKILGYLFGLPIRQYLLFALTLPVVVFATFRGQVPVGNVLIVYLLFGTSAILYHLTALVIGMVINKWWLAAFGTLFAVLVLYIGLPNFSHLHIYIFECLTIRPAIAHYLGPYLYTGSLGDTTVLLGKLGAREVPFFNYALPETWFSLALQSVFMLIIFSMLRRKWVQEHYHALSKVQAIMVLGFFEFQLLANLWPIFTSDLAGEVQARFDLPVPPDAISGVITTVVTILLFFLGGWLIAVISPTWHAFQRGWRRARRLGLASVPRTWDESPSHWVYLVIGGSCAAVLGFVFWLLQRTGYYEVSPGDWVDRLPGAYALGLVLFLSGASFAAFEKGRTIVLTLLVGVLPLMVATVLAAVNAESFSDPAFILVALSPIGTLVLSLAGPYVPDNNLEEIRMLVPSMWIGLVLTTAYTVLLVVLWWNKAKRLREDRT